MSNFGQEPLPGGGFSATVSNILGSTKEATLKAIRAGATGFAETLQAHASLTPVYKIMITTPELKNNKVVPMRYILADTSRPSINFLSSSDSPIVGLWVDQSDMTEPDKAIVLLHNPVTQISDIFEEDMLQFHNPGQVEFLFWSFSVSESSQSTLNLP